MIYVLWEFRVSRELQTTFADAYGPEGLWAELFRRDSAYRETKLLRDSADHHRYLTIDVWEDKNSYLSFKERFAGEYRKIDEDCEKLTSSERLIGIFEKL